MRLYVAGPMTGYQDLNFPAFHAETARLRELLGCNAIVLLAGWAQSRGATLEHHVASSLGLTVFHAGELIERRAA